MTTSNPTKSRWTSARRFVKDRKQIVTLAALVLALVVVYGWMFMRTRAAAPRDNVTPQVAKVLASWKGQIPQFPMFGPPAGFQRGDWRKMTAAQRHTMFMKRRVQMQAFFLAFAHANAAQQAAIVAAAKARFAAMRARWQQHRAAGGPGGGGPGGHRGGPGGRGNFASRLPQMMANHLISGNPQMHAAMTGFFMAMHNGH